MLLDSIIIPHKLEILRLCYRSEFFKPHNIMDFNLHRYENLFRLHLEGCVTELPEYDKLPQNLTKLTLVRTFLKADPMNTLKKLPKLKILKFCRGSYIGEKLMVCFGGGPNNFPQLQVLDITGLDNLKELLVEEEGMPQLAKLLVEEEGMPQLAKFRMKIPNRIHDITERVKSCYYDKYDVMEILRKFVSTPHPHPTSPQTGLGSSGDAFPCNGCFDLSASYFQFQCKKTPSAVWFELVDFL